MTLLQPRPYRHGSIPEAMRAAARALLEEHGPHAVGMREAARRIRVSATAAYRYYPSKEDLLAAVATEGFKELAASMEEAASGPDPMIALGVAYVEFALRKRSLFRLMFSPILAERRKHPELDKAVSDAFDLIQRIAGAVDKETGREDAAVLSAWGLVHGLSALAIDGFVPEAQARDFAERILARATQKPERAPGA